MSKADLYNHESKYNNWKDQAKVKGYVEPDLTSKNSQLLLNFIFDMEQGINVSMSNKKGSRSFSRLNTLRTRVSQMFRMFQERGIQDISKITEKDISELFNEMRTGKMKNKHGQNYKSVADYVKTFKSFYHHFQKVSKKKGKIIIDITSDVDSSYSEKPKWVYLDELQINKLLSKCDSRYKPLISFLFDSGARVTETLSVEAQDIHIEKGIVFVDLKDENSKTFGRKIKLLLCGKDLIEYIKRSDFKPEDKIFFFSPFQVNSYLGKLAGELFGNAVSKAGAKYSDLTMYDFRHNSCCYWIQRYKNNVGIMYKFGWKSEKYILYYSEFMGMRDLITSQDLYVDITKTELEKQLSEQDKLIKQLTENLKITNKRLERTDRKANKSPEKIINELMLMLNKEKNVSSNK